MSLYWVLLKEAQVPAAPGFRKPVGDFHVCLLLAQVLVGQCAGTPVITHLILDDSLLPQPGNFSLRVEDIEWSRDLSSVFFGCISPEAVQSDNGTLGERHIVLASPKSHSTNRKTNNKAVNVSYIT